MLTLHDVTKIYLPAKTTEVRAVRGVSLQVDPGDFVVITGRSGSGKTTLLNLAAGLVRPTSGRVMLDGADLWTLPDRERARLRNRRYGFVFQFPSLLPALNTLENVMLPTVFGRRGGAPRWAEQRARDLLALVGLTDKQAAFPRQLSAGQQQRVVIARALINEPGILMADEPTSDLDEQTELEVMELFSRIHRERGIAVVMVTHTRQLVTYGTRALEMAGGRIVPEAAWQMQVSVEQRLVAAEG